MSDETTPNETGNPESKKPEAAPEATQQPATETTAAAPAPKVAIGSQRDAADPALRPSKPDAVSDAMVNPVNLRSDAPEEVVEVKVAEVRSSAGLGDDIDAEIEAALGNISMDNVVEETEAADTELELNARVQGTVTKVFKDDVFFKLAGQYEGIAALHTFKEEPSEGDTLEVIVRNLNKEDGLYELTVPGATLSVSDWEDLQEGAVIEAKVTGVNSGGLETLVGSIRGFIPASQMSRYRVEDLTQFVDQKFPCVIVECKPDKRKLVLSHRAVLEREFEEKRKDADGRIRSRPDPRGRRDQADGLRCLCRYWRRGRFDSH